MNAQTFSELRNRYNGKLLRSVIGMVRNSDVAEDITATAFASAFKNLSTFRGQSSFYTWLYAIALNAARQSFRGRRTVTLDSLRDYEALELIDADEPGRTLEHSELCLQMRKALRTIPAIYRRVLTDHFIRGYSVREIARRERVPVGTVLSRIFSAKRILRQAWES